jgi:hypothetical protein
MIGDLYFIVDSVQTRKTKVIHFYADGKQLTKDIKKARVFSNDQIIKFQEKQKGFVSFAGDSFEFDTYLSSCKFMVINKKFVYKILTHKKDGVYFA